MDMEITYNDDDYDIYNCTAEVQITELRMNPYYISVIDLFGIIIITQYLKIIIFDRFTATT